MSSRIVTVYMTAKEAAAARRVRAAREALIAGQGSDALVDALARPEVAVLLAELADTWDTLPVDPFTDATHEETLAADGPELTPEELAVELAGDDADDEDFQDKADAAFEGEGV